MLDKETIAYVAQRNGKFFTWQVAIDSNWKL